MLSDEATIEAPQLKIPQELLEISRRRKAQTDYRIDAMKPGLLERIARMFGLGSR
jgi:hypothetical protein